MPKKTSQNFFCELCDFNTSKLSNYNKHLLTRKHSVLYLLNKTEETNEIANIAIPVDESSICLDCNPQSVIFSEKKTARKNAALELGLDEKSEYIPQTISKEHFYKKKMPKNAALELGLGEDSVDFSHTISEKKMPIIQVYRQEKNAEMGKGLIKKMPIEKMEFMESMVSASKMPKTYYCKRCNFECTKYSNLINHNKTSKHLKSSLELVNKPPSKKIEIKNENQYFCEYCGKKYKVRNSLWYHKKKCIIRLEQDKFKSLIDENKELYNSVKYLIDNGTNNTQNTINYTNKTFNLNLFLNEKCKDAINIKDFVKNIDINMEDFKLIGEMGYVNGMSNILIKNLKELDITNRPIHCTDLKREIIYIKDDNNWGKEDPNFSKVKKVLNDISLKNMKLLPDFKQLNPKYNDSKSNESDIYNNLVVECLGGKGNNETENQKKIIKNISKELIIEKKEPQNK